jgi:hypothetical protein
MRIVLFLLCLLLTSCLLKEPVGPHMNSEYFKFLVTSLDTVITPNQAPSLTVEIINNTLDTLLLVNALDGSQSQMRYPHVYYTINGEKMSWPRCGNNNCFKVEDLTTVAPEAKFNPFEAFQNGLPFVSFSRMHSSLFNREGVYDIQFHYSTEAPDIFSYAGSVCPKNIINDSLKVKLARVPRISLSSNILSIQVRDTTLIDI